MEIISLDDAKNYLDVIHDADDEKLRMLLAGAHDEALQFMYRASFDDLEICGIADCEPASGRAPSSVQVGVLLLLQAAYQAGPEDGEKLRRIAEIKLMPYRRGLGV